ncbi:MAG: hypothetical protein QJR09_08510 [Micrococcus sp.]|nr:hypothetical protein [Micrococcus sp.]
MTRSPDPAEGPADPDPLGPAPPPRGHWRLPVLLGRLRRAARGERPHVGDAPGRLPAEEGLDEMTAALLAAAQEARARLVGIIDDSLPPYPALLLGTDARRQVQMRTFGTGGAGDGARVRDVAEAALAVIEEHRGHWALAALAMFVKLRSTHGGREEWIDAILVDTWGHGGAHGIRWLQAVTVGAGRELRLDGELIAGPHLPQRLG